MLSEPTCGWTDITIGTWRDRASYLTNVHTDILDAIINVLENHKPYCVVCDAEGWEYTIVFGINAIHVIEEKDEYEYYTYDYADNNTSLISVAKTVIKDILVNIESWADWEPKLENVNKELLEKNKKEILEKIDRIKELIRKTPSGN